MRIKTEVPLTLSIISKTLGISTDTEGIINSITTHSTLCERDDLFVALKGENFDGADFIDVARKKQAFILSENDKADIKVKDAYKALLDIASYYRDVISPKHTIAVTGSVGKTTVKDFIATMLSSVMKTHKTEENYNSIRTNSSGLCT